MRLLVHACCAPCSIPALREFRGADCLYIYYNPNIHPFREYRSRLEAWLRLMGEESVPHEARAYHPEEWIRATAPDLEGRCSLCYRIRLEEAARIAAEKGYDALSTTLFASPYQNHELLRAEGASAASRAGVKFISWDGSRMYSEAVQQARDRGLYTQAYCGCILSERERYDKSLRPGRGSLEK